MTWQQIASMWFISMLATLSWFGIDLYRTRRQPPEE